MRNAEDVIKAVWKSKKNYFSICFDTMKAKIVS